jgi:hypothetical protein
MTPEEFGLLLFKGFMLFFIIFFAVKLGIKVAFKEIEEEKDIDSKEL